MTMFDLQKYLKLCLIKFVLYVNVLFLLFYFIRVFSAKVTGGFLVWESMKKLQNYALFDQKKNGGIFHIFGQIQVMVEF